MDIQVLREFRVLAQELNYSAAAERLFLSRSSLSKHISTLEKELGVQLLVRDSHTVKLTPAGEDFAERMETILGLFDDALISASEIAKHGMPVIRLGYLFQTAGLFLPSACTEFAKEHEIRLMLRAMEVQEIREAVVKDELDLGLTVCVVQELSSEYSFEELAPDSYGVIVPASSPLAKREQITREDLHGKTLYGPSPRYLPVEAKVFSRYFEASRDRIKMRMSLSDVGSLLPVLAMGAEAVFAVGHVFRFIGDDFVFVPFADFGVNPSIALLWRTAKESQELLEFVECVKRAFMHYVALESVNKH